MAAFTLWWPAHAWRTPPRVAVPHREEPAGALVGPGVEGPEATASERVAVMDVGRRHPRSPVPVGGSGFRPDPAGRHFLTVHRVHCVPAEILAHRSGVVRDFPLLGHALFRDRRAHRPWGDRPGRFAVPAHAGLVPRIPLIALPVGRSGGGALPASGPAPVRTFVPRGVGTEALVRLPRRRSSTTITRRAV